MPWDDLGLFQGFECPPPIHAAERFGIAYRPMMEARDLPSWRNSSASTRREEVAQTGWPAETQETFLRQQHEAQHSHYSLHFAEAEWLIVEREGEPIGRLYLRDDPDRLHIIDISLMPGSRGKGIGGAIMEDVIALARNRGKAVSIHVEKYNPALRLYRRLGFEPIEDRGVYDLMRAGPW